MGSIVQIAAVINIIIAIIVLVKFFNLCSDVRHITDKIDPEGQIRRNELRREVKETQERMINEATGKSTTKMKKLLVMMLMLLPILVGCSDKKPAYEKDVAAFSRLIEKHFALITIDMTVHEYRNKNGELAPKTKEVDDSLDIIYSRLTTPPQEYEAAYPIIQRLYQGAKQHKEIAIEYAISGDDVIDEIRYARSDSTVKIMERKKTNLIRLQSIVPKAFMCNGKAV